MMTTILFAAVVFSCHFHIFFSLELFALHFSGAQTTLVVVVFILTHVVFGVVLLHASMRYDH